MYLISDTGFLDLTRQCMILFFFFNLSQIKGHTVGGFSQTFFFV